MARFEGEQLHNDAFLSDVAIPAFRLVTQVSGAARKVQLAVANTKKLGLGVSLESYDPTTTPAPGHKGLTVCLLGTALVEAGGVVADGARCLPDANGRLVQDDVNGFLIAEKGAAALGDLALVRVNAF